MPKLSETISSKHDNASIFGIEIDTVDVTPPEGLVEAGIIAQFEDGDFSDDVIDIAISWILSGIDVTIEIPFEAEIADPKRTLSSAAAIQASISLLLPEEISDETFESYIKRAEIFAGHYIHQANMNKFVSPVTSYLGYMFYEAFDPENAANFVPTDPYVVDNFHSKVPVEQADALKARMRAVITEAYGGEEGFRKFALKLGSSIYKSVEASCVEEFSKEAETSGQDISQA